MKKALIVLAFAIVLLVSCGEIETETSEVSIEKADESIQSSTENIESVLSYPEEKSRYDEIELPEFPSEEESLEESASIESSEDVSEEENPDEVITVGESVYTNITDENALKLLLEIEETATGYNNVSFVYRDTETGYYFYRHRENVYPTVSVIKAFYCQYLLESGIDLEQEIQLTKVDRDSTSKKLQEKDIGTWFTVRDLMSYAIRYSDNMAYRLLYITFGRSGFNEFTSSLGIEDIRLQSLEYTDMSVESGAVYLERIYRYALETGEFFLIDLMKNTTYNQQITAGTKAEVAHKYGVRIIEKYAFHDAAIVFTEEPYLLIICTEEYKNDKNSTVVFTEIARLTEELHQLIH